MADRIVLTDIASPSWEHPSDRAALNALRAIPFFDEVVKKTFSYFGEKGLRQLFLANAVRVGPTQRPQLDALLTEVLAVYDWAERPQLYVTQSPEVNAMAIGFEKPFIVITSGALAQLNNDGVRAVLAHEVAHIMSGHVVYRTLAEIILLVGFTALPFVAAAALFPVHVALMEWYRTSELSSDRGALLATQDRTAMMNTFMVLAAGHDHGDATDLDAFMVQAAEYETEGDVVDRAWKVINTMSHTHPFATVRAGELQRWIDGGAYDRIIGGEYLRRADAPTQPDLGRGMQDAAAYYSDQAKAAADKFGGVLGRARTAFDDAFKGGRR
ncbi:MAG: M48 family metallopeptidase [Gemmatimonadetes bacterium]|nr:M48 family metallopeptidase [Gemmatimonadota bacterium]